MKANGAQRSGVFNAAKRYAHEARVQERVAEKLATLLPEVPDARRVVELGAGTGFLTRSLLARYPAAKLAACDPSPKMLAELERTLGRDARLTVSCCEAERFVFPEEIDIIASSSALQWVESLPTLFRQVRDSLASSGSFAFTLMTHGTLGMLRRTRNELFPELVPARELPSESDVLSALEVAGLHISKSERFVEREEHASPAELLEHLRRIGLNGGTLCRGSRLLRRGELERLRKELERHLDGRAAVAEYCVLTVTGGR